jgi:hypothetical protein
MLDYLKRILNLESNNTSKSTNGTQADFPKTKELTTNPQIDDSPKLLYRGDELKRDIYSAIQDCYPNIKNLNVNIIPSKTYIGNGKYNDKYYLNITWENGISECRVNSTVSCILSDYYEATQGYVLKSMIRPQLIRMFTESVILQVSQKYANCIAPNLPVNMHNIHCFKLGGVPIYDLAIGELRLMDEV